MQEQHSNQDQQQEQKNNPQNLAVSDEAQRQQQGQKSERTQQAPVGNEREGPKETEGSQAGMGE